MLRWLGLPALAACGGPERDLLEEAHGAVRDRLRDPESALFNDRITAVYLESGLVCSGEVNSRNGFGGMTGGQPYYYSRELGAALKEDGLERWGEILDQCITAQGNGEAVFHPAIE